ncbi:MAG: hypothetical protein C5B49_02335 [Bdellovibrio sp.]|nr:MAG: hypothetical protein C5B49_02335 [Bdellovibrio sp.]
MTMNPLPPQAYTRETLIKAYEWLQSQAPNVQQLATTPELLVSLFQKAKIQSSEALDRSNAQNFKSELKNLASRVGEFETAPAVEALAEASLARTALTPASSRPSHAADANPGGGPAAAKSEVTGFDQRSRQMIHEIRVLLNLSSDEEALRAMLAVAHQKIRRFTEL